MNAIKFENSFRNAPAFFVSGSSVVSIAVALTLSIISIILSAIVIAPPPGTA